MVKKFQIVLTAVLPKCRGAFCRHADVQHAPESTWTWEQPIWISVAHIVRHAFRDLVGDDLAQARLVDVSPGATAPHYVTNPNYRLLRYGETCGVGYVPLPITVDNSTPSSSTTNSVSPPQQGRARRGNTRANVQTAAQPKRARSELHRLSHRPSLTMTPTLTTTKTHTTRTTTTTPSTSLQVHAKKENKPHLRESQSWKSSSRMSGAHHSP